MICSIDKKPCQCEKDCRNREPIQFQKEVDLGFIPNVYDEKEYFNQVKKSDFKLDCSTMTIHDSDKKEIHSTLRVGQTIYHTVLKMQDEQVREHLILLGWTPPKKEKV